MLIHRLPWQYKKKKFFSLPSSSSNGFVELVSLKGFLESSSLVMGFLSSSRNGLVFTELILVPSFATSVSPWENSCSSFNLKFFLHSSILSNHSFYEAELIERPHVSCSINSEYNLKPVIVAWLNCTFVSSKTTTTDQRAFLIIIKYKIFWCLSRPSKSLKLANACITSWLKIMPAELVLT